MSEFLQEQIKDDFVKQLTELCYSTSNIHSIKSEKLSYRNVDFIINLDLTVYNEPEFEWFARKLEPTILNKDFLEVIYYIYPRRTFPYQRISYKTSDLPNLDGIEKHIHFIVNETFQLIDDILSDMDNGLTNKINYIESGYENQMILINKVKKSIKNLKSD